LLDRRHGAFTSSLAAENFDQKVYALALKVELARSQTLTSQIQAGENQKASTKLISGPSERGDDMTKELRTAEQLSDMIVSALGVKEVGIQVRKDHAYGWQPIVVSSPGNLIGYQRRVEEIANRLRFQFDLRE
jgi:hypothetical protein